MALRATPAKTLVFTKGLANIDMLKLRQARYRPISGGNTCKCVEPGLKLQFSECSAHGIHSAITFAKTGDGISLQPLQLWLMPAH